MPKFLKSQEKEGEIPSRIQNLQSSGPANKVKVKEELPDIESEVIKLLGKPKDFLKMEVKQVGDKRFRVNVVCSKYEDQALMPTISRPYSWYASVDKGKVKFEPEIVKL